MVNVPSIRLAAHDDAAAINEIYTNTPQDLAFVGLTMGKHIATDRY